MKIKATSDVILAQAIRAKLKENGGYCPCVNPAFHNEDTKCICKDFIEQTESGLCHCGLYKKTVTKD